jgi:RimJ/RimL family protein N-acetyltransferase
MGTFSLKTKRLEIFPLSRKQLAWYLEDHPSFTREAGPTSRRILTEILKRAIQLKIEKMDCMDRQDHSWITYWLIRHLGDQIGIGMLGFKGKPDYVGQIEIGYGIDPAYQNRGYTTEAARRLIQWAFEDPSCQRIIAPDTRKDNPASNRVLEKLGMKIYKETNDVFSWELDRNDFIQLC